MKKISLVIFFTIASIIFSTLIWEHIILPYDNTNQIYGEYFKSKYNPTNDTLRYIFYVLLPLITFLISYKFLYKESLFTIKEVIFLKIQSSSSNQNKKILNFFLYLILFLIFVNFLSLDFNGSYYTSKLDFYHEGVTLTPSKNFILTNGFWTSTFIEYGLFGNFRPIIIWKIFNYETIGSLRFFEILMLLFNNIILVLISKKISENLNFDKITEVFFFVFLSIIAISFVDYKYSHTDITSKFSLILLFLYVFFHSMFLKKKYININFFIGLFSAVSFFWYIDVGAYINIFIILLIIYFLLRKEYRKIIIILFGSLLGWLLFIILIPSNEILAFFENTKSIFSTISYIDGFIYPTPFISKDARATRALLLIIITGILLIILNFNKNINIRSETKIFFSFLYFISILIFGSAIVRADSPHIKSSSGLMLFLLSSVLLYFILKILKNLKANSVFSKKLFFTFKKNYFLILLTFVLINFTLIPSYSINFKKILSSFNEIERLLSRGNENYLTSSQIEMIEYFNKLTKNEKCVQIFTNESAIPYFLNKPTCSKYYSMTMAADERSQKQFVKDLKINKPKIILFESEENLFNDTKYRLPIVLKYIKSNYSFHSKFKFWTFVKINY